MGSHFKRFIVDGMLSVKSGALVLLLGSLVLLVFTAAYFVSKRIRNTSPDLPGFAGDESSHN